MEKEMAAIFNDQFVGDYVQERLDDIDVALDTGAIPPSNWGELHDERDALNELRYAVTDALNISNSELSEFLITRADFAERSKLKLGVIHATVDVWNGGDKEVYLVGDI